MNDLAEDFRGRLLGGEEHVSYLREAPGKITFVVCAHHYYEKEVALIFFALEQCNLVMKGL